MRKINQFDDTIDQGIAKGNQGDIGTIGHANQ